MKITNQLYFFTFFYTLILYWGTFLVFLGCAWLLRRNKRVLAAWIVVLFVFADLFFFATRMKGYVTQPRQNVSFNEHPGQPGFPQRREAYLSVDDEFRYFRPPLFQKFTAWDSTRMVYFNNTSTVVRLEELATRVMDGVCPLQKELETLTVEQFVAKGEENFPQWKGPEKFVYLNILELILESAIAESVASGENIQAILASPEYKYLVKMKKNLVQGYNSLRDSLFSWQALSETSGFIRYMVTSGLNSNSERGRFPHFSALLKKHAFLIRTFSVAEYVIYIQNRFRLKNVNTFVRTKNFDKIVNLYFPVSFSRQLPIVRQVIKRACAINSSTIQFFPAAEKMPAGEYFTLLSQGKLSPHKLYLDTNDISEGYSERTVSAHGEFTYHVLNYTVNQLEIEYRADSSGYVYFSDGYDRHWEAFLDRQRAEVYLANGNFKAVAVPAGTHRLKFYYNPLFFRISLWVYYCVCVLCGGYLLLSKNRAGASAMSVCGGRKFLSTI